jgi:hypothetical protein
MHAIFGEFDKLVKETERLYKMDTIGDAYICVGNVKLQKVKEKTQRPKVNGPRLNTKLEHECVEEDMKECCILMTTLANVNCFVNSCSICCDWRCTHA